MKGLADRKKLDKETNEGKLFSAILEMLEDTALAMEEVVDIQDEMQEQLNEVDEDLADVEDEIYGDDEDDDFYDCDDEGIFMTCPKCGDDIYVEYDADKRRLHSYLSQLRRRDRDRMRLRLRRVRQRRIKITFVTPAHVRA